MKPNFMSSLTSDTHCFLGLDIGKLFGLSLDLKQGKISLQSNPLINEYSSPQTSQQSMRSQSTHPQPQLSEPLSPQTLKSTAIATTLSNKSNSTHRKVFARTPNQTKLQINSIQLNHFCPQTIDKGSGHSKSHLNPGFSMCETKVRFRAQPKNFSSANINRTDLTKRSSKKHQPICQQNHCSTSDNELNSHQRQHNRRFTRFNRHFVPQEQNFQVGGNVVNRQFPGKPPPHHLGHPWPSHSLKGFFYQNY